MSVSTQRIFIERVRLTGPACDVTPAVARYQLRGFRTRDHNPLKLPGLRIDPERIGVTLERPHHLRYGDRVRNY